ncbi:MAG TPA: class I SAM-dependent methyltransferase [Verrucomicrobiae bacterium]|jgi:SAM-dependent methyltransferase|nr:class I SAM-dependent methyltransferase [Verrucomicrobiae bacterium]
MEISEYRLMKDVQDKHWLWQGRKKIVQTVIEKHLAPARPLSIADVGCGYGCNIPTLQQYGKVTGLELNEDAVAYVAEKFRGSAEVRQWKLPQKLERRFDLIVLIEVFEHIENDAEAVEWFDQHLEKGGHVLITTPAHQWLWTQMDEVVHHYRRYNRVMMDKLFREKFEIVYFTYYNLLLFPLKLGLVIFDRLDRLLRRGEKKSFNEIPPGPVNDLCRWAVYQEAAWMARGLSLPFGSSIVMLAKKRA